MSIWDRRLYLIGLRPTPGPRTYHFDASESLHVTLSTLSSDEGRPEHDLIPDILAAGLTQYTANERLWNTWESLSTRKGCHRVGVSGLYQPRDRGKIAYLA